MKFNWYELSIIKMKDKYVVISKECNLFGFFTFVRAIDYKFSSVSALDCLSESVYSQCGVTEDHARQILEGYFNYLVSIGENVEIKE